jgi:predicted MFS family arabinose efflux permease
VALLFFVNGVVVGSWLPRIPEIRDRLGIDLRTLGLTLALGGLGSLAGSAISGITVARFGARRTGLIPAAGLYFLLPLVAVVPSAILFSLLLALMGIVDSHADVGMNAVGVRIEESVGRSIMTRLHGLWSLGTLVGSGASTLALLAGIELGPHLAGVSLVGLATVLAARPLIPESQPRPRDGGRSGRVAIGLMLAGGTAVFVEGAPFDWSALFLRDTLGAGEALAGVGVILYTVGMLGGRLAGDGAVDRFGPLPTLFSGFVLTVASTALVVVTARPPMALLGFALWGLGISVALPVLYKLAGSHRSFSEGSGLAALTVGTRLGFMLAPALIGSAAAAWSLPTALAVVVGLGAIAASAAVGLTIGARHPDGDSFP